MDPLPNSLPPVVNLHKRISELYQQAQFVISGAIKAHRQYTTIRWKLGGVVLQVIGPRAQYGTGAFDELSKATHVHANILRECRTLAIRLPTEAKFNVWADGVEEDYGYIQWERDVRGFIYDRKDPNMNPLSRETLGIERDAARLERRARAAMKRAQENPDEVDDVDEFAGVISGALDTVQEAGTIPKVRFIRSKRYLEFAKGLPCCKCTAPAPSDPHHVESGGMGIKGNDTSAIPLCRKCHDQMDTKYKPWVDRAGWQTLHQYLSWLLTGHARQMNLPN